MTDHLPDEYKTDVKRKLQSANATVDYEAAKKALDSLHRERMHINPSAARSLAEGMEETLTVHKLGVPLQLRKTLSSTNVIESAFSIVETVCRNVKRWRDGDHIERWVASGLLVAGRQIRKVIGYRQIPMLVSSMANAGSRKEEPRRKGERRSPALRQRALERMRRGENVEALAAELGATRNLLYWGKQRAEGRLKPEHSGTAEDPRDRRIVPPQLEMERAFRR